MTRGSPKSVPRSAFIDRTVTTDDEIGHDVKRRANAYQFDPVAYRTWSSGGAVWLRPEDDNDDNGNCSNAAEKQHVCCNCCKLN